MNSIAVLYRKRSQNFWKNITKGLEDLPKTCLQGLRKTSFRRGRRRGRERERRSGLIIQSFTYTVWSYRISVEFFFCSCYWRRQFIFCWMLVERQAVFSKWYVEWHKGRMLVEVIHREAINGQIHRCVMPIIQCWPLAPSSPDWRPCSRPFFHQRTLHTPDVVSLCLQAVWYTNCSTALTSS